MAGPDDIVAFADERVFRARVAAAFERHARQLRAMLPVARVEHVGSTAVPDLLTKGDLDLCVIVPAPDVAAAAKRLASAYADNVGSDRNEHLASFVAPREAPDDVDVGVQLVAEGSPEDMFVRWRDLLRADEGLRRDYAALKRRHDGGDMNVYRSAKAAFIEAALGAARATASATSRPDFETALVRLRALLREQGWPERILWTRAQDVARGEDGSLVVYLTTDADDPTSAAHDYERARRAGHAAGLSALCTLGDATCVTVTSPTEADVSVASPRVEGAARWPLC
jgi:GrpB-like predicted nucleotidyltransferase (UPF0157 family)